MNRGLDWGLCLALCQKACGYLSNWALASPGPGLHSLLCGSSTNTLQHNPLCILNASVICPHANQSRLPPPPLLSLHRMSARSSHPAYTAAGHTCPHSNVHLHHHTTGGTSAIFGEKCMLQEVSS